MNTLSLNFRQRTTDQKHRLAINVGGDEPGDEWSYVQFREDVGFGDVVIDSHNATLVTGGIGTVTAAAAIGTRLLKDTGEFAEDDDKWLVGAVGYIHEGTGQGTFFYVTKVVDDDTLEIEVISSPTGLTKGGWPVALATDTKYALMLPGLVTKSTVAGIVRGVAQAPAKKGEYGFVKKRGWGMVDIDAAGNALGETLGIAPIAGGQAAGFAGTVTALNVFRSIGRYPFRDLTGTTDRVVPVCLKIENDCISYRYSDDEHALNIVDITGSR